MNKVEYNGRIRSDDYDVTRATAILKVAEKHSMAPAGGIPESDAAKIVEAEKIMAMTEQAMAIANNNGKANMPMWPAIEELWFEGTVAVGANGSAPGEPFETGPPAPTQGSEEPSVAEQPAAQSSQPAQPPQPSSSPAEHTPPSSTSTETSSTAPSAAPTPSQVSSASASSSPSAAPGASDGPQVGDVWADLAANTYIVQKDIGEFGFEVMNERLGEMVAVPPGFLTRLVSNGYFMVEAKQETNELFFTHPGCARYMAPLDDLLLPLVGQTEECANCSRVLPIDLVEANGYVSPNEIKEESPSTDSSSSASSPPRSEESSQLVQDQTTSSSSDSGASSPVSSARPRSSVSSSSEQAAFDFVDDAEGDERYRQILDEVEQEWQPTGMPVPHDLEQPMPMPDDITQDLMLNRRLHSERNALAARARYLFGLEHAKLTKCGRVRKMHFKRAFAAARGQLGGSATVTEVKDLAELDDDVTTWDDRISTHTDRAAAYKTFMEMYAEDVKTLSRDLTWAGAEEQGS